MVIRKVTKPIEAIRNAKAVVLFTKAELKIISEVVGEHESISAFIRKLTLEKIKRLSKQTGESTDE